MSKTEIGKMWGDVNEAYTVYVPELRSALASAIGLIGAEAKKDPSNEALEWVLVDLAAVVSHLDGLDSLVGKLVGLLEPDKQVLINRNRIVSVLEDSGVDSAVISALIRGARTSAKNEPEAEVAS